jgi:integrase
VGRYFAQAAVRSRTLEGYQDARDQFLKWCQDSKLRTVRHLNRSWLVKFREHVVKATDRNGDERSPHTINAGLKRTAVILNYLIDAQVLRLTRDDVRVALKRVPTDEVTKRDFLRVEQIHALLEAAKRHDAITYKATRGEHAKGEGGSTPRYEPIHDYIRFLLLSGLRPGEALAVTWDRVDFPAHQMHVHRNPSAGDV